jgi:hypothetical protein
MSYNRRMTTSRRTPGRLGVLLAAAAFACAAHAQSPLRTLPKDASAGYLTHVTEMTFNLDGQRVRLAPGGIIRGANNMILMPGMVPRESLVAYQKDADGNLSRAWVLSRDEAAKANVNARLLPWQTSPEAGTALNQILGGAQTAPGQTPVGARGQAPGFMQQLPPAPAAEAPATGSSQ